MASDAARNADSIEKKGDLRREVAEGESFKAALIASA
jgi:hypothetical protein